MLQIGGKVFMNIQEAVGWLLQNNALPFQSTANYVADTEIAKNTIINPSPAEIKVGALVLFADSKIGTVSGLTSNGFMVGSEHTDIKNALAYIVSVAVNASNHLITTLSDGTVKDAGLIREVSSMSINGSQHLIVNYNDGTTNDLGAIFTGNINISGNITASGNISGTNVSGTNVSGNSVTGDSIIELMSGYNFTPQTSIERNYIYAGICKNGNKLTLVVFLEYTPTSDESVGSSNTLGSFAIPSAVADKLFPYTVPPLSNVLSQLDTFAYSGLYTGKGITIVITKGTSSIGVRMYNKEQLTGGQKYLIRCEATFLLNDNLVS